MNTKVLVIFAEALRDNGDDASLAQEILTDWVNEMPAGSLAWEMRQESVRCIDPEFQAGYEMGNEYT